MSQHTFKPGDVVKRTDERSDPREFEVVGDSRQYPGMVLCSPVGDGKVRLPFWPQNLTLVRAAGEGGS